MVGDFIEDIREEEEEEALWWTTLTSRSPKLLAVALPPSRFPLPQSSVWLSRCCHACLVHVCCWVINESRSGQAILSIMSCF